MPAQPPQRTHLPASSVYRSCAEHRADDSNVLYNQHNENHESVGVVIKVVNTESNRVDGRIFYKNGDHHKFMALVQATVHGELFSIVCYDFCK